MPSVPEVDDVFLGSLGSHVGWHGKQLKEHMISLSVANVRSLNSNVPFCLHVLKYDIVRVRQALFRTVRRSADRTFPSSARPICCGPMSSWEAFPRLRVLYGASSGASGAARDPVEVKAKSMDLHSFL